MLLLPNGHGLVAVSTGSWYDVTFTAGGSESWAPTITDFPAAVSVNSTVTLSGTQLCGLSECQSYGDDNQQAEHYPMVRFTDADQKQFYLRAHDVSTRSIAPARQGTVLVDIPSNLPWGTYTVQTIAMGIPSAPRTTEVSSGDPCLFWREQLEYLSQGDFNTEHDYLKARAYFIAHLRECEKQYGEMG